MGLHHSPFPNVTTSYQGRLLKMIRDSSPKGMTPTVGFLGKGEELLCLWGQRPRQAGTVLTDLALGFRDALPPVLLPPAPRADPWEGDTDLLYQKTRLYISSETSESNRDCCFFLSLWDTSPALTTSRLLPSSTFLHPKLPSARQRSPPQLLRPKTKCRVPALLPPFSPPSSCPLSEA